MTDSKTDIAIIGAGPYGLSIAAHLKSFGADFRIFGTPMKFWLDMSPGICLKSPDFATNIYAPKRGYRFDDWSKQRGLSSAEPCPMPQFAEYGLWAQQQLVPEVEDVQVVQLGRSRDGFRLTLDSGETVIANRTVVAVGLSNFPKIPTELQISSDRITHTAQVGDYARFRGMAVTVIGGGQSALEAGGLLNVNGATARVLVRNTGGWFADKLSPNRSLLQRFKWPMTELGTGQLNWVLTHVPRLASYLPQKTRTRLVRKHLGPFGTWWVRDQCGDAVAIEHGVQVVSAREAGMGVELTVVDAQGERTIFTDHVLAGTGYEVDVDRIPFLDEALRADIVRVEKAPAVSRSFESSVNGLFFVGPAAMFSYGPLVRFTCGARHVAPRVARRLVSAGPRHRAVRNSAPRQT